MAEITSTGSGLWSAGATWVGGSAPVNGDSVVIAAGHAVQIDSGCDHENDSIILIGITITSHATTPGRLYWKDDAVNGCGNIACSGDIIGTNAVALGQLVATADGTLADTDPLSYTYKAVIRMSSTGSVDCTYLDINMLCDNATKQYVTPYLTGSKQDFNAETAVSTANDTITIENHGLSNGDKIGFHALSGTLPTPLRDDIFYYVRSSVDDGVGGSDDTFKVAYTNSDDTIVDITAVGSGTTCIYKGADTTNPVPVIEDVTADNWANGDYVVTVNVGPQSYDQQHNIQVSTIAAGTFTLSAALDGSQNPGARIYQSTKNCSILHSSTSTSQNIIENGSNCVFGEIRATNGTGTTFRCYGIYSGSGNTATTISGCNYGINSGSGHTITTISGCSSGISSGSGNTATTISGCNYGISSGSGNTATTISGCTYGIGYGSGHTITTISGCTYGIGYGSGNTATTISGCTYGTRYGSGHTITTISGCTYGINSGSHNRVSNLSGNSTDIDETYIVYASGGVIPATPDNNSLNQNGEVSMILSENHAGTYGTYKLFQSFGNAATCTAGDGSPIPNQRASGNATLICLDNLQTNLSGAGGSGSADNKIIAWEPGSVRVWATASVEKTYRFYIQSSFAITSADDFKLISKYFASAVNTEWTTIESDETITQRDDVDDWDQYVEVTITPARTGWIKFECELRAYSAGGSVYIDPLMVIS